jgi:hypothetical protein
MLLERAERADAGFLQDIISIRAAMRQPTGQGIGIREVGGNHGRKLSVLLLGAQKLPTVYSDSISGRNIPDP